MYKRLKEVRKSTGDTQTQFAEKLGTSRNAVASYELSKVIPNDTFIQLLCSKFSINEHWLRTGEGEMYVQSDTALIEELATEYNMSEKQKKIIATFAAMDEKKREILTEAFFEFLDAFTSSSEVSATTATRPAANDTKLTVEQKRHIVMTELPSEEKGQTSSAFTCGNGSGTKLA